MVVSATFQCRIHPRADEMPVRVSIILRAQALVSPSFGYCKDADYSEIIQVRQPWRMRRSLAGRRRVLSAYQYIRLCTTDRLRRISFANGLSIHPKTFCRRHERSVDGSLLEDMPTFLQGHRLCYLYGRYLHHTCRQHVELTFVVTPRQCCIDIYKAGPRLSYFHPQLYRNITVTIF